LAAAKEDCSLTFTVEGEEKTVTVASGESTRKDFLSEGTPQFIQT